MAVVLYISGLNRHRSPAAEIITNSMAEKSGIDIVACSAGLVGLNTFPYRRTWLLPLET